MLGGPERTRTAYLPSASGVFYQVNYGPWTVRFRAQPYTAWYMGGPVRHANPLISVNLLALRSFTRRRVKLWWKLNFPPRYTWPELRLIWKFFNIENSAFTFAKGKDSKITEKKYIKGNTIRQLARLTTIQRAVHTNCIHASSIQKSFTNNTRLQ